MTQERLADLKAQATTDKFLASFVNRVIAQADEIKRKGPLEYEITANLTMLGVSRDCVNRVYTLGMAWRWTGDRTYLYAGIDAIVRASEFPDWNPSHFLDTAEMSHAVGLGYDWFFHELTGVQKQTIRKGLVRNGLQPGLDAYGGNDPIEPRRKRRYGWWKDCDHNWNIVCNCGLIIGALAVAETDPEYAQAIIPAAAASMPRALEMFGPDGAWAEGPGYWGFATRYLAYGFTALRTALDTDLGLLSTDGVSEAGLAPIYVTGPTDLYFNYADSKTRNRRRPMFQMFWLSDTFQNAFLAGDEHRLLADQKPTAQHVVWYVPKPRAPEELRTLDKHFRGPVQLALMRSSWDADALFVGFKAGYNQANHGHLDLGSFELDALGVRWIRDLGSDLYTLPGYWDGKRGGKRWEYWNLGTFSHNVITIDAKNQDPLATASMTQYESETETTFAIVDLSKAYLESAKSVTRGIRLVEGRRAVLTQDEISVHERSTIVWGITTDAQIDILSDREARLTLDGNLLYARILSGEATFSTTEAPEAEPPMLSTEGIRRLHATLETANPDTLAVLLSPVWPDGATETCEIKPLLAWKSGA